MRALLSPVLVATGLALLFLVVPQPAQAERIQSVKEVEFADLPLRATSTKFQADPMRRARDWPMLPLPEGGEEVERRVEGRDGRGPWRLFQGTFPEETCRSPEISGDAAIALAICSGLDVTRLEDEHVVLLQTTKMSRYRSPLAKGPAHDPTRVSLSEDGKRFAVLVEEGGASSVHFVDLVAGLDYRLSGAWNEPGNPKVAPDTNVVSFPAKVGRERAAIVIDLTDPENLTARMAWRDPRSISVYGIADGGDRIMIGADTNGLDQLYLVDVNRGSALQMSPRKGSVTGAAMHPSGEAAVFAAELGGVCAVYWADMVTRRFTEVFNSVETCFKVLNVDDSRRRFLYQEKKGREVASRVYDRKIKGTAYEVIKGCEDPTLSVSGLVMAVRCPKAKGGAGAYLFVVPGADE